MKSAKHHSKVEELSRLNARIRRTCIRISSIESKKNWTNNERLCEEHGDLNVLLTQLCDEWNALTK